MAPEAADNMLTTHTDTIILYKHTCMGENESVPVLRQIQVCTNDLKKEKKKNTIQHL